MLNEFGSEKALISGIQKNLIEDKTTSKDLAISDCQIGQTAFTQFDDLQIPPEQLFSSVHNIYPRLSYKRNTVPFLFVVEIQLFFTQRIFIN